VQDKYYLADRSNRTIDILDLHVAPPTLTQTQNFAFAGFTGNNDTSGPNGVATVNNHTELWVGDSPGRVWVLNADASVKVVPPGASNPLTVMAGQTTRADEFCYDSVHNIVMITLSCVAASIGRDA